MKDLLGCFQDGRDQSGVEHSIATLIGQRVFAIALDYEDLNEHLFRGLTHAKNIIEAWRLDYVIGSAKLMGWTTPAPGIEVP